jgi:hypothetical protein
MNYLFPCEFLDKICKVLFNSYNFLSIYILNSNSLPLYLTGCFSGIVLDSGFLETQIVAFDYGVVCSKENCEAAGHMVNK